MNKPYKFNRHKLCIWTRSVVFNKLINQTDAEAISEFPPKQSLLPPGRVPTCVQV